MIYGSVCSVRDSGDWRSRPPLLLERESLSRNPPPSREAGEVVAPLTANGTGVSGPDFAHAAAGHIIANGFNAKRRDDPTVETLVFNTRQDPISGTITGPLDTDGTTHAVAFNLRVRRLTPRECERLQGFEDDYTLIPYRGKPTADTPRYKALGNSMAVPVMRWIGERIQQVENL